MKKEKKKYNIFKQKKSQSKNLTFYLNELEK